MELGKVSTVWSLYGLGHFYPFPRPFDQWILSRNFWKQETNMASETNLKSEDAIPGSSKITEEPIKILEAKGISGNATKKSKISKNSEHFTDKERIRMEEEGLSEK